jgi:serine/threonine protein kinase/tetratricopeptide (TPR) repeat protein
MAEASHPAGEREARLQEVLLSYVEAEEAGQPPRREDWLARHPEFAEELDRFLEGRARLDRVAAPLRAVLAEAPAAVGPGAGRPALLGDFRILGELGRGGMGVVYEAEQVSLGRKVALKVLPAAATLDPRRLQRFINEARAAASLHHTNIVPVFAVGSEQGVHFYAMQLIAGQTLATVLGQLRAQAGGKTGSQGEAAAAGGEETTAYPPPTPAAAGAASTAPQAALSTAGGMGSKDYIRSVARLGAQAAEALDYAHQLGVVHRDIKPGNLMVDARGQLWVTDFGLVQFRREGEPSVTVTGDLVGTVRYMSPEQALAKRVPLDHRTDVYSLGATLYELLTLRPAFDGKDQQELLRQIAFDEPAPLRKVNRAIPAELETVVLKCLEKDPAQRYGTAQELADDLRRFLEDKPVRARRPSPMQRLRKWARRHRLLVASAAVCLLVSLAVLAGSVGWVLRDRAARAAAAERHVAAALDVMRPGLRAGDPHAVALVRAARQVEAHLASDLVGPEMRGQAEELLADLALLARLEQIRLDRAADKDGRFDLAASDRAYADAFRGYGIDVEALRPEAAAARLKGRTVAAHLAAALDDWATHRQLSGRPGWRALLRLAQAADPEPDRWRAAFRAALARGGEAGRKQLKELAAAAPAADLPPVTVALLGGVLMGGGRDPEGVRLAVPVLRAGQRRHPADLWLNHNLALALAVMEPPQLDEAIGYFRAALALRPESPAVRLNFAFTLKRKGRLNEAVAECREAIRLRNNYAAAHNNLGAILCDDKQDYDGAIAAFRQAIRFKKDDPETHHNLGVALTAKGRVDEAAFAFREAIRRKRDYPEAYNHLGVLFCDYKHNYDEAITLFREAIRLKKDFPLPYGNLGIALARKGLVDEAIIAYREALRLKQDYPEAHCNLGDALRLKGRLDEAVAECRKALRFKNDYAAAHLNLGNALRLKGRPDEAVAEYRKAIRLKKDFAVAHNNLGVDLRARGRLDEAIAELREALRLDKNFPLAPFAHYFLGLALSAKDRPDEATAAYRETVRLREDYAPAHNSLAWLLATCADARLRDPAEAVEHARKAVELVPGEGNFWNTLGVALYRAGEWKAANEALEKSMRLRQGGDGCDWLFLAMSHWRLGDAAHARAWHDRAVRWIDLNRQALAANRGLQDELRRFRAEADELLGVSQQPGARPK